MYVITLKLLLKFYNGNSVTHLNNQMNLTEDGKEPRIVKTRSTEQELAERMNRQAKVSRRAKPVPGKGLYTDFNIVTLYSELSPF